MTNCYYPDLAFLLNFFMDYLLLRLVKTVRKKSKGILWPAAAFGAVCACLSEIMQLRGAAGIAVLFLTAALMCIAAFGKGRGFWKNYLLLLFLAFVFGGVTESMWMVFEREKSTVIETWYPATLWLAVISAVLTVIVRLLCRYRREEGKRLVYKVRLQLFEQEISCCGLLDTGNCLYEPFGKRPVILLTDPSLQELLKRGLMNHPEKTRFVPYHSVGRDGILEGTELGEMRICLEEEEIDSGGVVAVCTDFVPEKRDYQLILHPDLLEGRMQKLQGTD